MNFWHFITILILNFACDGGKRQGADSFRSGPEVITDSTELKNVFPGLLQKAVMENKKLFLVFGFEKCGWCRVFEKYHRDPEVSEILSAHFIVAEIDYNKTPGGKELYRTFGSTGFPSWAIIDTSGIALVSSEAPVPGVKNQVYNVGYPAGSNELSHYIHALKTVAVLSSEECDLLRMKIEYYHKSP